MLIADTIAPAISDACEITTRAANLARAESTVA
jgi:hypothetical protein